MQNDLIGAIETTPCIAQVEEVSLDFQDGTHALKCLSLRVSAGECLGIVGPNGAGKTSLLRLLAGLLTPSSGRIILFGHPKQHEGIAMRRRIGYLSQRGGVDDYLTGRGNVLLSGRLYGLSGDSLMQHTQELLALLELRNHAEQRTAYYSGGMRRRLALACSLVHQPDLLLLDEPTTGLDALVKAALWRYLLRLQREGLTIIVASHDTQEIERYCQRVVLLHHGLFVLDGPPVLLKAQVRGDRLALEFIDDDQMARALMVLADCPCISVLPSQGSHHLSLEVPDGSEAIPAITRLLESAGVSLIRLTLSSPTLEDVFLQATGEQLTDSSSSIDLHPSEQEWGQRHKRSPFRRRRMRGNE